jgi:Sulfotransferase family
MGRDNGLPLRSSFATKTLRLITKRGLVRGICSQLFPQTLFASRTHLKYSPAPLLFPLGGIGLIWSAKSACTTSILWYFAIAGLLKEALAYDPWPHKYSQKVLPDSARYRAWLMNADPRKLAWVRVIRNPYKRAVSSFRHVLRYSDNNNSFRQDLGLNLSQDSLSFDSFLSKLETVDITACDIHFRQQHHPLERSIRPARTINADREPLLDALLDFATPTQDVRLDLDAEISRISSFHHAHRGLNHGDVSKTPFKMPFMSQDWPAYESFLNDSTRRKIERIYAADFSAYSEFL